MCDCSRNKNISINYQQCVDKSDLREYCYLGSLWTSVIEDLPLFLKNLWTFKMVHRLNQEPSSWEA